MKQEKTIRPRNWFYECLVAAELIIIVGIWRLFSHSWQAAFIRGGLTYLLLAWTLRLVLQRHHRKGMKLLRGKQYEDAAKAFRESFDFFAKHPWIDKYCFITMFSSNAIPYQQMALNNMGVCYLHMGENAKALDAFKKLLKMNPNFPDIAKTVGEIEKHIAEIQEKTSI